ncbi:MAG: DEAD/DEAH box helicase [Melioribacteraceae bacterium]|nr:DEAD/DEAH box helicase [Melioribacteraceae bacterium]
MISFEEMGISPKVVNAVKELGFENPMPIQKKVIPHLMQSDYKDLVALAQTGTGKTAAYGLPIIEKTDPSINKIQFLILSPTRELCLQISDDLASFAKYMPEIKIAAVFGGASIDRQIQKIQKGVHIVSATPGRLVDLINRRIVNLNSLKTVILDEADEMLSMGFRDDLETILQTTPKQKNTLLFSATMPNEVASITKKYMIDPVELSVGKRNAGAENVEHLCYIINARERYQALKRIVDFNPDIYGIVFCRTRKETQEVADQLMKDSYNADSLHGDLSQGQRDIVMNKFRIKHLQLLIATDVAARGLDVENLTHIINYNLPEELDIYTHRSGRTGRAGKKGISIAIAGQREKSKIHQIEKQLNKKFSFVDVPSGKEICEKQLFHLIDRVEKVEVEYSQIDPLLPDIFRKLEWLDREELIKKFVSVEFNRFLDYYKNAADLNAPQEYKKTGKGKGDSSAFTRFFINLGRTDELRPNSLMGLINEFTGISDIEIGKIELLKNFSFFEVDSDFSQAVLNAFKDKSYKKRKIVLELAASKGKEKSFERGERKREDRPRWKDKDKRTEKFSGKREDRKWGGKKDDRKKKEKDWERGKEKKKQFR